MGSRDWKNGTWTGLPPLSLTGTSAVNSLVVSGSDVYAAGFSTNALSVGVAGYWKDGAWTGLTPLNGASDVNSVVVNGTDIYAAGFCNNGSIGVAGIGKMACGQVCRR